MKSTIFPISRQAVLAASLIAAIFGSVPAEAGHGRYRFNQQNTPGWSLMTPAERAEHQNRMLGAKSYDECKAIQAEHHTLMEARAKEKGLTLGAPRQNACDRMKARGVWK